MSGAQGHGACGLDGWGDYTELGHGWDVISLPDCVRALELLISVSLVPSVVATYHEATGQSVYCVQWSNQAAPATADIGADYPDVPASTMCHLLIVKAVPGAILMRTSPFSAT